MINKRFYGVGHSAVASQLALRSHFAYPPTVIRKGKTVLEVMGRTREAVQVCVEEREEVRPLQFVGLQQIEV